MESIKQLFHQQRAGFTVYSPDCTQSRLWGNLDHTIHDETGFSPVYRQWINHRYATIARFYGDEVEEKDPIEIANKYETVPVEELQSGHMVIRLFLSGPSLLTVWQGKNVIETLLKLKGVTHPAEASYDSIRGRFWCDNAVANLTHTSDDYDEAVRELTAIELPHILDAEPTQLALITPRPAPIDYMSHCSIAVVYDVLKRQLMTTNNPNVLTLKLPESGEANETNQVVTTALNTLAKNVNNGRVSEFVDCYLAGDIVTVTTLMKDMPVSKWEHFIIQCGALTRDKWNGGE